MVRQVSAGGVVVKRAGPRFYICLIARRKGLQKVWCLPKGHVEKGESLARTALREVKEETGISGKVLSGLGSIRYTFFDLEKGRLTAKKVHFFLVRYESGTFSDHDDEVESVRWLLPARALRLAEYPNERVVLRKALEQIGRFT